MDTPYRLSIVGLNLGVTSMLIEFIVVAKYNLYIVKSHYGSLSTKKGEFTGI